MEGNPFAAGGGGNGSAPMVGNPFDPMAAQPTAPPPQNYANGGTKGPGAMMNDNPFGMGQPPSGQPLPPHGQPPQPPAYGAPGGFVGGLDSNAAMVVSPQQSNPYGVPPQQQQQAMVPAQQQGSPWAVGSPPAAAAPKSFDPFAAPPQPPPPVQAPPQQPPPQQYPPQELVAAQPPPPQEQQAIVPVPPPDPPQQQAPPQQQEMKRYDPDSAPQPVPRSHNTVDRHNPDQNYTGRDADTPRHVEDQRDRQQADMGRELQRTAAVPGSSPLPKPELVRKKGHVLSRISFRTIVMKKWKQAYWVQYGPHTMLWFRSHTDFNDWLNNPYHNQAQRNFLIKLAVNFVHDLYKPSVRGYQVTQCRTKAYGSKMVRQFKLERWMDYGPTIAAAFGSYNPKEVDDLRQAIVECMRNTPLSNGIRATGAVRQQASRSSDEGDGAHNGQGPPPGAPERPPIESQENERRQYATADGASQQGATDIEREGKDSDLLDLDNWDDVSVQQHSVVPYVPGQTAPPVPGQPPSPPDAAYGGPPQHGGPVPQSQYGAPPQVPPQQPPFGSPPPQQAPYGPPAQEPYAFASPPPQQSPYGAPPPPQQNPYGAPPPPQQAAQPQQNPFGP